MFMSARVVATAANAPSRCGGGMIGHRQVHDPSPIVGKDDEDNEQSEGDGRHDEEVGRHDLFGVVREDGAPGLRWRRGVSSHVLGYGGPTHRDAQFLQLAENPRCTPERIRRGELADQGAHVLRHTRTPGAVR